MNARWVLVWLLLAGGLFRLDAQQGLTFSGSIRSRLESWDWFTASTGDHAYTYNGSTVRFGVSRVRPGYDWTIELEAPILLNLPTNSVAPGAQGQLGQGASYYIANDRKSNVTMLFPKQVFARW